VADLKTGDTFTLSGIYRDMPNPAWRWWALWRPRFVASSDLQTYRVVGAASSEISVNG